METHEYRLDLMATGEKTGRFTSLEGEVPPLEVASPPQFGGPGETWSPEHLFVASVAACLMTTFRAIAALSKLDVVSYTDTPVGRLVRDENRLYRISDVTLRPHVVVGSPEAIERANRLLEKAKRACLVSRSVSAEVTMEPRVDAEPAMSARNP